MKTTEDLKLEWQKHNRDHGLTWNEVAELVNEVTRHTLSRDRVMEMLYFHSAKGWEDNGTITYSHVSVSEYERLATAICNLSVVGVSEEEIDLKDAQERAAIWINEDKNVPRLPENEGELIAMLSGYIFQSLNVQGEERKVQ